MAALREYNGNATVLATMRVIVAGRQIAARQAGGIVPYRGRLLVLRDLSTPERRAAAARGEMTVRDAALGALAALVA
jgi:hypothetical protein